MNTNKSYRYRLTVSTRTPGLFRFEGENKEFVLAEGHKVEIVARDADTLATASQIHFDGYDFPSEESARMAGERMRLRLRVMNAVLGLGLNVPLEDTITSRVTDSFKSQITRNHDVVILDSIAGLAIHPNDGRHFEYAISTRIGVHKPDGEYLLKILQTLWKADLRLDQDSEDALSILGAATRETSPRAAFLTTYLAVETLIPRAERSASAKCLLSGFLEHVSTADLNPREASSLQGAIGGLGIESFPSAINRYLDSNEEFDDVDGWSARDLISECIKTRNAIAHKVELAPNADLTGITRALRTFALKVIWTASELPSLTIDVPADHLTLGKMSIRVL